MAGMPSIVLKTLLSPPHNNKDPNMSADGTLRPRSLTCCIGNLFRRRFLSTNKLYLPAEKEKLQIEACATTNQLVFAAGCDDRPPIYKTALTTDFGSRGVQPRLVVAPGILGTGHVLSEVPRGVVQGAIPMTLPDNLYSIPREFLPESLAAKAYHVPPESVRQTIPLKVPESLSRRFAKEKEILQNLWIAHQQQRQQNAAYPPKAITSDPRDSVFVCDKSTGTMYKRGRLLGKGGFAKCYELIDVKSNKVYAGKIISKSRLTRPRQMEKILREVELHSCLHHPNVVEFRSFFEDQENVYMVLENCSRKTLIHMLKSRKMLTEPEVRYYMRQLVEGCQYVHGMRVIHRDLKLGNMLVNEDMQLKIADFGLATRVEYEGEKKMTVCGTPNYIAPEVLQKKGHSYEADIWAMGCIMYALLCGRPPFETNSLKETYSRITSNNFYLPNHVSTVAKDLIYKLLHPEPLRRPKLDRIFDDPFFTTGFTPLFLPSSCCDIEPKFTTTRNVKPKGSGVKTVLSSIEQMLPAAPKPSPPVQKLVKPEPLPQLEFIRPPPSESNAVVPYSSTKQKTIYQKHTKFPVEQYQVVSGPEPAKVDINLQQSCEKPQRKSLQRSSTAKYASVLGPDFVQGVDKRRLNFEKDPSQEPRLSSQLALQRKPSSIRSDSSSKQSWVNVKNLKEENAFSACSPMRLFQALSRCLEVMPPDFNPSPVENCRPLWVTKWVDYSNKYGFGFQLSDRTVGILFNDTTRIILSNDNRTLVYNDLSNRIMTFTKETAPSEHCKKVTLLLYFIEYMNEHLVNCEEPVRPSMTAPFSSAVFMKKWFRTDKAVVMYLNNGTLQLNFLGDHTKLIIGVDGQDYLVTYVDAERQMLSYRLLQLSHFGCCIQLDERLRYAQRMLENVMNLKGESV